jgi:hypothetical protein
VGYEPYWALIEVPLEGTYKRAQVGEGVSPALDALGNMVAAGLISTQVGRGLKVKLRPRRDASRGLDRTGALFSASLVWGRRRERHTRFAGAAETDEPRPIASAWTIAGTLSDQSLPTDYRHAPGCHHGGR